MSVEQELKLHVLKTSRQAVKTMVDTAQAETIHLHAFYFDTQDRELARAGIALRLRKEPEGWIQTIKLPGDDALSKIELNHPRPEPTLDLGVYIASPAERPFSQLKSPLLCRFETDIHRTLRHQSTDQGLIELAFDSGVIRSGPLELPVCELEFELKAGEANAIFELAKTWQAQHRFVLDFRSKAERGDALADLAMSLSARDKHSQTSDLPAVYQQFKLWQAYQEDGAQLNYLDNPRLRLKKHSQKHIEHIARNAAIIAGIERSDMNDDLSLDLSPHLYHLSHSLHTMVLLWSAFRQTDAGTAPPEEMLQTLKDYQQKFSQLSQASPYPKDNDAYRDEHGEDSLNTAIEATAAQQQAGQIAASADFQQYLLEVLAWSILN